MVAGLILGLFVVPIFAIETRSVVATTEQNALIERHRGDHARALAAGAAEACVAAFAKDVRVMPQYHDTVFGRNDAAKYYSALLGQFRVSRYDRSSMAVLNLGERLVEFGRFSQSLVRKDNGQERELEGTYMDIWSRANEGAWEVVATTWNYSQWPAFADELRFPEVPGVRVAFQAHLPIKDGLSFELGALNKLQEIAIVQGDHAVWSQFYTDDAVLLSNQGPVSAGRQEIDAYIEEHVKQMPVFEKLDIRNDRIDDLGSWVIDYASHVANWRNGDSSGVNTGKNIRIWRREPRGGLKMVCQIGSYD